MPCRIEIDDYDSAVVYNKAIRRAKTQHCCCECKSIINKGEEYEIVKAHFEGEWSSYKTCLACVECRTAFMAGWYFGGVWEDIREGCRDELTIKDLDELPEKARNKIMEMLNL